VNFLDAPYVLEIQRDGITAFGALQEKTFLKKQSDSISEENE